MRHTSYLVTLSLIAISVTTGFTFRSLNFESAPSGRGKAYRLLFSDSHTTGRSSYEGCFTTTQSSYLLASPDNEEDKGSFSNDSSSRRNEMTGRRKIRSRVKDLARGLVSRPLVLASTVPMPRAIAEILKDASLAAVEQVDEVIHRNASQNKEQALEESREMMTSIIDDAFAPVEASLMEMEKALIMAKQSLAAAKMQSSQAIEAIQVAAIAQAEGAATAVAQAEIVAERQVLKDIYSSAVEDADVSKLSFDDVDYDSSEMAPPFLDPDSCLVPGEPVVRVEKAPENSRRIFAGIDIMASVDDVWNVLTDYENLQNVVPNLVVNKVLALYDSQSLDSAALDVNAPAEVQCKQVASKMKGSLLKQVGGAKVAGINFSAKTTLEVREWPQGMPDFAHFTDDMFEGKSRDTRAKENSKMKLRRYRFPRPFALSSLPTKDISMQSIVDDDGEFRMYQGVWRMQPLPGCSPPGKNAMRLTYAVEISPRVYLPVQLVEGRIVRDLCTNLEAIRDAVSKKAIVQ